MSTSIANNNTVAYDLQPLLQHKTVSASTFVREVEKTDACRWKQFPSTAAEFREIRDNGLQLKLTLLGAIPLVVAVLFLTAALVSEHPNSTPWFYIGLFFGLFGFTTATAATTFGTEWFVTKAYTIRTEQEQYERPLASIEHVQIPLFSRGSYNTVLEIRDIEGNLLRQQVFETDKPEQQTQLQDTQTKWEQELTHALDQAPEPALLQNQ